MMNKKGFTLAELLIVVVIIGVLGAIALPKFYPQKEKAVVAEAAAMLSAIRQGEVGYSLENNGNFYSASPMVWQTIGIANPNPNSSRFSYTVDATARTATATRLPSGTCAPTASPATYNSCTIVMNLDTGAWTGDHPFRPNDAS